MKTTTWLKILRLLRIDKRLTVYSLSTEMDTGKEIDLVDQLYSSEIWYWLTYMNGHGLKTVITRIVPKS